MKHPAETFLEEIEAFLTRSGMPAYKFGKEALGDPSFVNDVRTGRMPSLRLVDRVNKFMAAHDVEASA